MSKPNNSADQLLPAPSTLRWFMGCVFAIASCMLDGFTSDAAEVFAPGVISDDRYQWRITFTPDGETAYFASSDGFFPFTRQATIYVSHLDEGEWSPPEIAPFSGEYIDIDPFIEPNGQRLYFSSIRPVDGVTTGDLDVWMVERTPQGWGEPTRLGPEVNTPHDELYPSASADGMLYFASGPIAPSAGTSWDIYNAAPAGDGFEARRKLPDAINRAPTGAPDEGLQDTWDFNPEISADGQTLIFTSLRPGGFGLGDLYASRKYEGEWTQARNLGPTVNTTNDEYHPTLSPSGRKLYFVRRTGEEPGNFYRIALSETELEF